MLIPIFKNNDQKKAIKSYISPIVKSLKENGIRFYEDWTDSSPGYKFNQWELKGVPIRLEVGPKDINKNNVVFARRDTGEKTSILKEEVSSEASKLLNEIQKSLFEQAKKFRDDNTHDVSNYEELKKIIRKGGFVRCGWDGSIKTESIIKQETKATIRCILRNQNISDKKCVYSGREAKHNVIIAKAY